MATRAEPDDAAVPRWVPSEEVRELAMHALALSAGAAGMAHRVRNPLNAMALQVALLGEKLGAGGDLASSCGGNLNKLREQIERIDEALISYLATADPDEADGTEASRLVERTAALLGHEARRRRVTLVTELAPVALPLDVDGPRVQRVWTGVVWRALVEAPEGGTVRLGSSSHAGEVWLTVSRVRGGGEPSLCWIGEAAAEAARAMGGSFEEGEQSLTLRLPGGDR